MDALVAQVMFFVRLSGPLIRTQWYLPVGGDWVVDYLEGNWSPFMVRMDSLEKPFTGPDDARLDIVSLPNAKQTT